MNDRFIYDEKTSSLYAPDGVFLKQLHCPKALNWNQLVVENNEQRWRNCDKCKEKVLNLDVASVNSVLQDLQSKWSRTCVHVSSKSDKVIFLQDANAPPKPHAEVNSDSPVVIHTARSFLDIDRALGMGYWPDVRFVEYDTKNFQTKISVGQNPETGAIDASGDYRRKFGGGKSFFTDKLIDEDNQSEFLEIIPFTYYYQYYRNSPIAAYLIPRSLKDGTAVLVPDPIEDIVGSKWNQGSAYRASDVTGFVKDRKVVLNEYKPPVRSFVG